MTKKDFLYYIEQMYFLEEDPKVLQVGRLEKSILMKLSLDNKEVLVSIPPKGLDFKYYTAGEVVNETRNSRTIIPKENTLTLHCKASFYFGQLWIQDIPEEFHLNVVNKPRIKL